MILIPALTLAWPPAGPAQGVSPARLKLEWGEVAAEGCLGQGPWPVQVVLNNPGPAASEPGEIKIFLNGQVIRRARVEPLGPAQARLVSFTFTRARLGGNTLAAQLDLAETKARISLARHFSLKDCRPDLAPVALRVLSPGLAGREPMKAEAVVANLGGGEAREVEVRFLVDDREIKTVRLERLEPGRRRPVAVTWQPVQGGVFRLKVKVLAKAGEKESNPNNNFRQVDFETLDSRPRLTLSRPDLPANVCLEDSPVRIKTVVRNQGRRRSSPTPIRLRQGLIQVAEQTVPALDPGKSAAVEFLWRPDKPEQYELFLLLAPEGRYQGRPGDHRNIRLGVDDCRPDLRLVSPRLAEGFVVGRPAELWLEVVNSGRREAKGFDLALRIDQREKDRLRLEGLPAGRSRPVRFTWKPEKPGLVRLEAVIDPEERLDRIKRPGDGFRAEVEVKPAAD